MARPRLRLVCLPPAGGGASVFAPWHSLLPADVELVAVQLPGREDRISEPPPADLDVLLDDLARALGYRDEVPLTLFGHSWGALLAFELCRRFQSASGPRVAHLVVAGACAPQFRAQAGRRLSDLSRDELVAGLGRLGNVHPEILARAEYVDLLVAAARTDLRLIEQYRPAAGRLTCPITALGGADDPLTSAAGLDAWRACTTAEFRLQMFPGDHFFVVQARPQVVQATLDFN